jgi:hypothetical protein
MSDKWQKNQLVLACTEEGRSETPKASQECGPLSPLLSNIVLDELDRELERRKVGKDLAAQTAGS